MIIYLISLLVIGSAIAWSLKKAPSDTELWGEDEQEKESKREGHHPHDVPLPCKECLSNIFRFK